MAQTQEYRAESVENLSTAFPRRAETSFAWGNAISYYLGLPGLRAFWPMSSVNETGNVYDLSGQGRTLTNNNAATFGVYGLQSYATFNGVNQYLSRADEAGLDITGELTMGCWIRFHANATQRNIMGKRGALAATLAYYVRKQTTNEIHCVFTDGGGGVAFSSTVGKNRIK
jgi:hypothetical protein